MLPPAIVRRFWWAGGAVAAAVVGALLIAAPSQQMETPVTTMEANPVPGAPAPAGAAVVPAPAPSNPVPASIDPPRTATANPVTAPPVVKPEASAPPAPAPGAKELFASTDANVSPGIRFRLIQAGANDAPMDVDPGKEFRTGDRLRFAFESNIDGYLYVAQQGASGNWTVLFPNEDINGGRNRVKRFEEYEVPRDNYFLLDHNVGTEQIFVFLSREPLNTLPGFDRPARSFEPGSPALIAELRTSIQSRDLVFQKDSTAKAQATYVVNRAEVGKAVTASFNLIHK